MNWLKLNVYFFIGIIVAVLLIGIGIGGVIGGIHATKNYNDRCMKYFGNKGYPADGYCKLFIGEIKARDEQ